MPLPEVCPNYITNVDFFCSQINHEQTMLLTNLLPRVIPQVFDADKKHHNQRTAMTTMSRSCHSHNL